jgi:hypothetical protein
MRLPTAEDQLEPALVVEFGHTLRISTRFENQALKKFHWNSLLALFYWRCSDRLPAHEIRG